MFRPICLCLPALLVTAVLAADEPVSRVGETNGPPSTSAVDSANQAANSAKEQRTDSSEDGSAVASPRQVRIPHKPVAIDLAAKEVLNAIRRGETNSMLFLITEPRPLPANNDSAASAVNRIGLLLPKMWPARQQFLQLGPARIKTLVEPGTKTGTEPLTSDEADRLLAENNGAWGVLNVTFEPRQGRNHVMLQVHTRDDRGTDQRRERNKIEVGVVLEPVAEPSRATTPTKP